MSGRSIRVPLFEERGIEHGFGVCDATPPGDLRRPQQVHGRAVVHARACAGPPLPEADAVVCDEPGVAVAVVTADCLPILLARSDGRAVAAVHAGWRGLAAGVIEAGVAGLRSLAASSSPPRAAGDELIAAVGPHIGMCCYEVDAPVLDALSARFPDALPVATRASRPGHALLDLGVLARRALEASGVAADAIASLPGACTRCDALRFHSYRRDGAKAGRLVHFVRVHVRQA